MSYNLLNFPTGNFQGRVDTLENIVDYYRPHLLMVQELQNEDGLNQITDMMNGLEYGNFASADFVQQQSDPFNPYYLQQNIVFDQNYLTLKNQLEIITDIRDVNYFRLYFNDSELANGADTTYLHVFVTHLKSSSGSANEQLRLQMVEQFISYIENNLDDSDNILFAGDFNLYDTAEPAYQALINESNTIVMQDPFASFGNWAVSNFQHREILTQSTRASQIGNDGAGGGLDDRFDFILFSPAMMNALNPVHFIEGTFKSLGNNGTCYNQSITNCTSGNEVPSDVIQSIYYMSDHIPQVCEIEVVLELG
ncbi:MAG: endonuclease/exonuclease/phosphatase family protein [Flavobacteriales bacterium]